MKDGSQKGGLNVRCNVIGHICRERQSAANGVSCCMQVGWSIDMICILTDSVNRMPGQSGVSSSRNESEWAGLFTACMAGGVSSICTKTPPSGPSVWVWEEMEQHQDVPIGCRRRMTSGQPKIYECLYSYESSFCTDFKYVNAISVTLVSQISGNIASYAKSLSALCTK